jgi:hypothetical protein
MKMTIINSYNLKIETTHFKHKAIQVAKCLPTKIRSTNNNILLNINSNFLNINIKFHFQIGVIWLASNRTVVLISIQIGCTFRTLIIWWVEWWPQLSLLIIVSHQFLSNRIWAQDLTLDSCYLHWSTHQSQPLLTLCSQINLLKVKNCSNYPKHLNSWMNLVASIHLAMRVTIYVNKIPQLGLIQNTCYAMHHLIVNLRLNLIWFRNKQSKCNVRKS